MTATEWTPEQILADALESRNSEIAELIRDGRRLRAERGRMAVVQATFDLIQEGENPTIAEVADRAGISERTVFRYFADREALMAAVAGEVFRILQPMMIPTRPKGDLDSRLRSLLEIRIEIVRIGGPFARSVEMNSPSSQLAKDILAIRQEPLRAQVLSYLDPEISEAGPHALLIIDTMLAHHFITDLRESTDDDTIIESLFSTIRAILA